MKHAILATWRTSPLRFCSAAVVALAVLPVTATAVEPRATRETQQAYWALTERLALALPGGKAGVSAILAAASAGPGDRYRIDPMLVARDVQISTSAEGRVASIAFGLEGPCIPFSTVRERYPQILVLGVPHGTSDQEWHLLGTQVGDAIIEYGFPASGLGCMKRTQIMPARAVKIGP